MEVFCKARDTAPSRSVVPQPSPRRPPRSQDRRSCNRAAGRPAGDRRDRAFGALWADDRQPRRPHRAARTMSGAGGEV